MNYKSIACPNKAESINFKAPLTASIWSTDIISWELILTKEEIP